MSTKLTTEQCTHLGVPFIAFLEDVLSKEQAYSGTWAPTAIAAGGKLTLSVAIPGALVGSYVLCSFSSALGDGILKAQVTAPNTVTVTLHNLGSSSLAIASGTLRIAVIGA